MRILMTGATGYIGSHLLDRLVKRGDDVRVLALPGTEKEVIHQNEVRVLLGSLDDVDLLVKATRGARVVYHLGGLLPNSPLKDLIRVNVHGTENLLGASIKTSVGRFVYVSSTAVYKRAPQSLSWPITENFPLRTSDRGGLGNYARTKIEAEGSVIEYHRLHNLEHVILRPGVVYGPHKPYFEMLIAKLANHPQLALHQSARYGDMQWIHISDLADALLLAGSVPDAANQVFNIVGSELFTITDLIPIVWNLLGRDNRLTNNLRLSSGLKHESSLKFDLTKARKILRFQPRIKLEDGLQDLVALVQTDLRSVG